MNRIQQKAGEGVSLLPRAQVLSAKLHRSTRRGLPHYLFSPLHYEPNYAYPLLVWLHQEGGHEQQLQRVMPLISMRNYAGVAPRGVHPCGDTNGFMWGNSTQATSDSENHVFEAIEIAKERFHVAPDRVFIAGYQDGGTMALRIALKHPGMFAGALSVAGAFPEGQAPLSRLNEARKLPIFLAHGRQSTRYPIDHACRQLRLFHAAGMSVSIRQYPGGDDLDTQMLHDIDVWMMELVTGQSV